MAKTQAKKELREEVRIPLVGEANTRKFWNSTISAGPTSGYVGIGVVGQMIVGSGTISPTLDQRFINVIPDRIQNPMTEHFKFYLYKRPGFDTHTTPASGSIGTAIHVWKGQGTGTKVISAFGGTNSTIYDGTTSLGAITGIASFINEADVAGTPNIIIAVENNKGYYYPDAGSLTEITNANYPGNASQTPTGSFVNFNGFTFIMTTSGRIYNSDFNSISAWSALGYLTSGMWPDQGVGLARYKDTIMAFGQESIEFYKDVGNKSGTPLRRVDELTLRIGALGEYAICESEDTVFWVSASAIGARSVYMLENFKPVRISTDVIDTMIQFNSGSTLYITSAKISGKTFVFLNIGVLTYVYSVEDKMWHEWSSANAVLWYRFAANPGADATLYSISRASTSGKVYKINPVSIVYQDDGTNIACTVQTSKVDFGTEKYKFLHRLAVVGDNSPSATNLSISWSDDDYTTFNTARTVALASTSKFLNNCGRFKRRAFKLTETSAQPFRLEALELTYTIGLH